MCILDIYSVWYTLRKLLGRKSPLNETVDSIDVITVSDFSVWGLLKRIIECSKLYDCVYKGKLGRTPILSFMNSYIYPL